MKITQVCTARCCDAQQRDLTIARQSIPNSNFGGICGDVIGATKGVAKTGALLLVAAVWRAIESRVWSVVVPEEESGYRIMFKWFNTT